MWIDREINGRSQAALEGIDRQQPGNIKQALNTEMVENSPRGADKEQVNLSSLTAWIKEEQEG